MPKAELPQVMTMEHEAIHGELARATRAGGKTEQAAREVSQVLLPHIFREEEFAIPALLLLPRLARGEVTPDMANVLSRTETLKAELPRMFQEHQVIVAALQKLLRAATVEKHTGYARFAQKLILHAQTEEEVLYPASILVGEYLKLKLAKA